MHDYLDDRLFQPLGMQDIEWETCPLGINQGGGGAYCTTEDLAKFGQLYLQDGVWNGIRILPEGWVELSTSKVVDNPVPEFCWKDEAGTDTSSGGPGVKPTALSAQAGNSSLSSQTMTPFCLDGQHHAEPG